MKILIGFAIFLGVGFIIALIEYFKEHRKKDSFGDWFMWYVRGIANGTLSAILTFLGISTNKPQVERFDNAYAEIDASELQAAIEHTHGVMNEQGWSADNYRSDALDCDDFAMKMKVEATKFLVDNGGFSKGIPIHLFGYTKDSGSKHMLIYGVVDGARIYYEVYPGPHNLLPKILSLSEEDSCELDFA